MIQFMFHALYIFYLGMALFSQAGSLKNDSTGIFIAAAAQTDSRAEVSEVKLTAPSTVAIRS